jgi:hypothetical protein
MKTTFEVTAVVLLFWIPLYAFYWEVCRKFLLTKQRNLIYASRDELRMLVIDGKIEKGEKSIYIMEQKFKSSLRVFDHLNLLAVIMTKVPVEQRLIHERNKQIIEQAPPEIRKIYMNLEMALIGSVLFNSPLMLFFSLAVSPFVIVWFLFYVLVKRTKHLIDDWNEKMWSNVFSSHYA